MKALLHVYKASLLKKMADVEGSKSKATSRKTRSFEEKEISLLIAAWTEYPCLFDKGDKDYHDKNKQDIAKEEIAKSLNEAFSYEKGSDKFISGSIELIIALMVILGLSSCF